MTQLNDYQNTPADNQRAAVSALDDLLALDLPALTWRITPTSRPELTGQPFTTDDDEGLRALTAWAERLGAEVVTTEQETYAQRAVTVDYDGVKVFIFDHVNVTHEYVKVAKAEPTGGAS